LINTYLNFIFTNLLQKNNANQEHNHQICLDVMPRCSLFSAKIMQIESRITKLVWVLCRDAAYFLQRYTIY